MLGFAKTRKEAKTIISQGKIMVDGKVQRDELFPVGLMDVISIPEVKKTYRILSSRKGLTLHPIEKDEVGFKLCRIENKTIVDGGHVQLNLHDGRNILIRVKDPKKPEEDVYRTMDTLKISIPNQEVIGHMKLVKGASAIIVGGKNVGRHGKIVDIEERLGQKRRKLLVTTEDAEGKRFQTTLDFVFVTGDAEPSISLPGAS
jgi:small subunit ribosomal protein S4e